MSNAPEKPAALWITLAFVSLIAGCLALAFAGQVITHNPVKETEIVFTPAAAGSAAPASGSPAKPADKPKSADASKKEDPKAPNSPLKVIGSGAVQVGTLE